MLIVDFDRHAVTPIILPTKWITHVGCCLIAKISLFFRSFLAKSSISCSADTIGPYCSLTPWSSKHRGNICSASITDASPHCTCDFHWWWCPDCRYSRTNCHCSSCHPCSSTHCLPRHPAWIWTHPTPCDIWTAPRSVPQPSHSFQLRCPSNHPASSSWHHQCIWKQHLVCGNCGSLHWDLPGVVHCSIS